MFYHGSSTKANIDYILIPPEVSGVLSEVGRKKRLNKIFFTKDINLARIYAGRSVSKFGGDPVIYRVVNPVNVECMKEDQGASVYYADWSFCEKLS